jgi:type IV secretion system protein VirB5
MSDLLTLPPPVNDFEAGKRQYLELYGSVAVMNTYLKIALLACSVVIVGLLILNVKTYELFHNVKPLVIRISQAGQAEAINYGSLDYHPQEAEIKYFLVHFVQGYYGRMRATIRHAYPASLYFLDGRLSEALMEANKKTRLIETFLNSGSDEVDVQVRNVALEDLRQPPFKASVEFEKVFYAASDHRELRRERFVASFVFIVKEPVPNALIPFNPLGLTITYFRDDQAFSEEKP